MANYHMKILFLLPPIMTIWTISAIVANITGGAAMEPSRWLAAVMFPIVFALYGLKKKSLDMSGAALGMVIGTVLTLSSYVFLGDLMAFFLSSSRATKLGVKQKAKYEDGFKEGGQRNFVQVFCNGGVASVAALLYIIECGCTERAVDFGNAFSCSWYSVAVLGALACCNGDTWASEIGTILSKGDPYLITSFRKVPKGTNGGVSFWGLVMSFLGGVFVGLVHYITILLFVEPELLRHSPPQWMLLLVGGIGGLLGSMIDSLLGATLQYSGLCKDGRIVERPGDGVQYICGHHFLDNHSINLISSMLTAVLLPSLANLCISVV